LKSDTVLSDKWPLFVMDFRILANELTNQASNKKCPSSQRGHYTSGQQSSLPWLWTR